MRIVAWGIAGLLAVQACAGGVAAHPASPGAGLNPAVLSKIDSDIAAGVYEDVDSLLIIRHGRIVFDRTYAHDYSAIYATEAKTRGTLNPHDPGGPYNYFNPWWHPYYRNGGELHSEQSVTKTVASIVIGVATSRGEFPSLDTPVLKFFDESKVANVDARKRHLTLRHLITMTAGVRWNDDVPYSHPDNSTGAMEASADWVKYFIDQPMQEEPGTRFYYNDGAPQALAQIFETATGQDMETYAAEHLFKPLGITKWFWKRTPSGVPDAEGGLYLDRHDLAKLVILFQRGGRWEGRQIVSPDWVKASITPAVTVNEKTGVKYGYLWWLRPYGEDDPRLRFGGSGFGGQFPEVMTDYDTVIVVNGWSILPSSKPDSRALMQRVVDAVRHGAPARQRIRRARPV